MYFDDEDIHHINKLSVKNNLLSANFFPMLHDTLTNVDNILNSSIIDNSTRHRFIRDLNLLRDSIEKLTINGVDEMLDKVVV